MMEQLGKVIVDLHEDLMEVGTRVDKVGRSLDFAERQLSHLAPVEENEPIRGYYLRAITRDRAILRRYRQEQAALLSIWFGEEMQP